MAELCSLFYFKHHDKLIHKQLTSLLDETNSTSVHCAQTQAALEQRIISAANSIRSESGAALAESLLDRLINEFQEFVEVESLWHESGYCVSRWHSGYNGDLVQQEVLRFLYALCPDIHAQSWGRTIDDTWEYWFKFYDGKTLRCDDKPFEGEDDTILGTVYRWWYTDMPVNVRAGILYDKLFETMSACPKQVENVDTAPTQTAPVRPASFQVSDEEYQQWVTRLQKYS